MGAVATFANETKGYVRDLPYSSAVGMVQSAWKLICAERRWSFLRAEANIPIPVAVTAGTVTVTQFSGVVVGDATAAAAWAALGLGIPITDRQFRLGAGSPLYNVLAFDGANSITLDRVYTEPTQAGIGYTIYKAYIAAPVVDFQAWISMWNPSLGYRIRRRNLYRNKQEIDRWDPQRSSQGPSMCLAAYGYNAAGFKTFEMWPHYPVETTWVAGYQSDGTALLAATELPSAIPRNLFEHALREAAYEWALANNKPGAWIQLLAYSSKQYKEALQKAKLNDEQAFPQTVHEDEEDFGLSGPVDAAFMQSHDVFVIR